MNELEIINHNKISGLTVFFNTVDYRTPHFHQDWELIWVLTNPIVVVYDGKSIFASEGELLLLPPYHVHELRKLDKSCTFLCLQVSSEMLRLKAQTTIDCISLNTCLSDSDTKTVCGHLKEIMESFLDSKPYSYLYCMSQVFLLYHFLFSILPVRPLTNDEKKELLKKSERLSSLIQFVDENYMHKIRLSDFAESEGFSVSYLSHFIRKTLNQNFQDYVNTVRVNCACKLMTDSSKKLTDISIESGFSDYRYFSNAFKKQFNLTPEQYRMSLKAPNAAETHHSIHSLERFYTDEESLKMIKSMTL